MLTTGRTPHGPPDWGTGTVPEARSKRKAVVSSRAPRARGAVNSSRTTAENGQGHAQRPERAGVGVRPLCAVQKVEGSRRRTVISERNPREPNPPRILFRRDLFADVNQPTLVTISGQMPGMASGFPVSQPLAALAPVGGGGRECKEGTRQLPTVTHDLQTRHVSF